MTAGEIIRGPIVAFTQPYVPGYRVPLLGQVVASLAERGVAARVFYGGDPAQMMARRRRGDGADVPWAEEVAVRSVRVGRTSIRLQYKQLPAAWRRPDVMVTEMAATNLNAWSAAARRRKFITWGHGDSSTGSTSKASRLIEDRLNRRASSVLAYTVAGRAEVMSRTGRSDDGVVSIENSTDTDRLRLLLGQVSAQAVRDFRVLHQIPEGAKVGLYLGALNEHKEIPLLVDTFRRALALDPSVWLVVAGDGPARPLMEHLAQETGRVSILGQTSPEDLVVPASLSGALLNPGRIGLVAVDALALGLPIITSEAARHAPEAAYLREGLDVFTAPATGDALARLWLGGTERSALRPLSDIPSTTRSAGIMTAAIMRTLGGL
ncbi:MAG: hypothetical protein JWP95_1174 [Actinotalea sp.]|nr:hypothetical protein [Actinotalea sp.]